MKLGPRGLFKVNMHHNNVRTIQGIWSIQGNVVRGSGQERRGLTKNEVRRERKRREKLTFKNSRLINIRTFGGQD